MLLNHLFFNSLCHTTAEPLDRTKQGIPPRLASCARFADRSAARAPAAAAVLAARYSLKLPHIGTLCRPEKSDIDRVADIEPPAPPLRAGKAGVQNIDAGLRTGLPAEL